MNNLIEFLKNNFHYFLFAVLLVLCLLMMGKSMSYSHYKFARFSQAITGPIQKNWSEMVHTFSLGKENEDLVQQNIALMREHDNMFIVKEDTTLTQMTETDSLHRQRMRLYDYTFAHVIFKTTDQAYNYIVIDKGGEDGICKDMAVTSPSGVVGVVSDVSDHFAAVIPILHPDSRISALVSPINQVGTVVWRALTRGWRIWRTFPSIWRSTSAIPCSPAATPTSSPRGCSSERSKRCRLARMPASSP